MQQNKNLMLFFMLSMLIMVGWSYLQQQLFPPPPQPKKQAQQVNPQAEDKTPPPAKQARWDDLPPRIREALVLMGSPVPVGAFALAGLAEFEKKPPPIMVQAPPREKLQKVTMGGDTHNLVVTLTTLGGGVEKLVLNKFQAADWRGQPVNSKLELIPEDPITPSFLMYHYPDEKAENPVLSLGEQVWKLESKQPAEEDDEQEVRFSTRVPNLEHLRITKTYRLKRGTYHLELSLEIKDERKPAKAEPTWFRYQLTGSHGLPIEGEWYTTTFRTAVIGMVDGRSNARRDSETSDRIAHRGGGNAVPEGAAQSNLGQSFLQYAGVMNQYFASLIVTNDKQPEQADGSDGRKFLAWARPTLESQEKKAIIDLVANGKLYLRTADGPETYDMLPRVHKHIQEADFKDKDKVVISYYVASDGSKIATWIRRGHALRPSFDDITVRVHSQKLALSPGQRIEHNFLLYHGPAKVKLLGQFSGADAVAPELVDRYSYTLHLRSVMDYGRFYWWSDLLTACTSLMHFLLYYLRFLGDGMSIILLTILVRGLLFPISRRQALFSVKMQQLAPEMKKIQEKHKDDMKARAAATQELHRKHNINPLGGCLPLLLQMPIMIGLYFALGESIHFRLARFLWMENLAAPDMLFYWGESIPLISDPDNFGSFLSFLYLGPYFNLLPLFAVGLMITQQIIMTPPPQDEQQAMQFKMMRYMMIVIGIMFYKIAAGLCMYIIVSSIWGLVERRMLPKKQPLVQPAAAPAGGSPRPANSGRKPPSKPQGKKNDKNKVSGWWQDVLKQARKK